MGYFMQLAGGFPYNLAVSSPKTLLPQFPLHSKKLYLVKRAFSTYLLYLHGLSSVDQIKAEWAARTKVGVTEVFMYTAYLCTWQK